MKDREVFLKFVEQEQGVKEMWQTVKLFEAERQKFAEELRDFEKDKRQAQELLDSLALKAIHLQEEINRFEEALKESEQRFLDDSLIPLSKAALKMVEVRGKEGKVLKALPVGEYYSRVYVAKLIEKIEVMEPSFRAFDETQERLLELELENAKLKVEIRDLRGELKQYEEEGA